MNAKNQRRLKIAIIAGLILLGLFLLYTLFFKKAATSGSQQGAITNGSGSGQSGVTIVNQPPAQATTQAANPDATAITNSTTATQANTTALGTLTSSVSSGFSALQTTLSNLSKQLAGSGSRPTTTPTPSPVTKPVVTTGQGSVVSTPARPTPAAAAGSVVGKVVASRPQPATTPGVYSNPGNISPPRTPGQPAHIL